MTLSALLHAQPKTDRITGDIESFIRPLFEELAEGSEGWWIWDALESAHMLMKACIAIGAGDMLGSAKINGMAGHAAIYGDRF
ncbi:hypothetical protein BJ912DRAFT_863614, partial [Pholiota molesta]